MGPSEDISKLTNRQAGDRGMKYLLGYGASPEAVEASLRRPTFNYEDKTVTVYNEQDLAAAKACIARLEAELEKIRPKPVVTLRYLKPNTVDQETSVDRTPGSHTLKLTFTDGKLTKAEVVG